MFVDEMEGCLWMRWRGCLEMRSVTQIYIDRAASSWMAILCVWVWHSSLSEFDTPFRLSLTSFRVLGLRLLRV